jgi:hypothetical protein
VPAETTREAIEPVDYVTTLFRSHCDVADQWSFIELFELLTQARENLYVQHNTPTEAVRLAVAAPTRSVFALLRRPMFAFDPCTVTTRAFHADHRTGAVVFAHTVRRPPAATPCMTAWELLAGEQPHQVHGDRREPGAQS